METKTPFSRQWIALEKGSIPYATTALLLTLLLSVTQKSFAQYGFEHPEIIQNFEAVRLNDPPERADAEREARLRTTVIGDRAVSDLITLDTHQLGWGGGYKKPYCNFIILPKSVLDKEDNDLKYDYWNPLYIEDEAFEDLFAGIEPPYPELSKVAVLPKPQMINTSFPKFIRLMLVSKGKVKKYHFFEPGGIDVYIASYLKGPEKYLEWTDKTGKDHTLDYPFDVRHFKNTESLISTIKAISILTGVDLESTIY